MRLGADELKGLLDTLYRRYTKREFAYPDPVVFLYPFADPGDREVVGMIASSLAYGRVQQILNSVSSVLEPMGDSPRTFLEHTREEEMRAIFKGFKHRFTTGEELVELLSGMKQVIAEHGGLGEAFSRCFQDGGDVVDAACRFVEMLIPGCEKSSLLPNPRRGSACKRLFLFFRWMVRRDEVDPGGWMGLTPDLLLVPLDVHMHRVGRILGFTNRASGDLKTAREVTRGFARLCPEDPVRYDFALTRFGIREEMEMSEFVAMVERLGWRD